ncbi:MAG: TolC family protein [Planctomycetota bacterium]|nr:TolC family protein [Planctomycetota bacterium]
MWALQSGCTLQQYRDQADRTSGASIAGGQKRFVEDKRDFSIEYRRLTGGREGTLDLNGKSLLLHGKDAAKLTLEDVLTIAFRNSREYQTRKEHIFSQALAVANGRRGWDSPLGAAEVSGFSGVNKVGEERTSFPTEGDLKLGLTQQLERGGVVTMGLALATVTDFLGSENTTAGSLLSAGVTQPLLRGAGAGLAYETQYRLERDFAIALYDFSRYEQEFAADVTNGFYRLLQQRDRLENELAGIKRIDLTYARTKALFDRGQVSRIQTDQSEQNLLNAQVRLEQIRQTYEDAVDAYKIIIGLPVTAAVEPAYPEAMDQLQTLVPDVKDIPVTEARAVDIAMRTRPDVLTQRAALRDAGRNVEIAADAFSPQVDLQAGVNVASKPPRQIHELQFHKVERFARVTLDYNFDQTDNRDAYRNSIIALAQAQRDYDRFGDDVRLSVRRSLRALGQSRRTYQLQRNSVQIAERRYLLAAREQSEGQAIARDVLEAEDALRFARNGLTDALVGYATTRLDFLGTLGMLQVDAKGRLHERAEPVTFRRIAARYAYAGEPQAAKPGQTGR